MLAVIFILDAAQLFKLFSKYKAEVVALSSPPRRNLITGSSSTSLLLFILDTSLNKLYWCEHFHTHELFTLRNSLTPAVWFITKHWQLRFLAIYKGQSIYRKYKELRDTSPGKPTPGHLETSSANRSLTHGREGAEQRRKHWAVSS